MTGCKEELFFFSKDQIPLSQSVTVDITQKNACQMAHVPVRNFHIFCNSAHLSLNDLETIIGKFRYCASAWPMYNVSSKSKEWVKRYHVTETQTNKQTDNPSGKSSGIYFVWWATSRLTYDLWKYMKTANVFSYVEIQPCIVVHTYNILKFHR